jgi:hypothetical protein
MAELFERCPVCHGSRVIPFGTKVCDYPAHLTPPACICTLSETPGWAPSGLTSGQFDLYRRKVEAAERFKTFVHEYLTQHGVPEGDPENPHQKEGCRIGARLDLMFAERNRLCAALEELELGQFRSGWLTEAEAIWTARDTTECRNDAAILWAVRCRELLRAMKAAHAAVSEEPALQACPLGAGSP